MLVLLQNKKHVSIITKQVLLQKNMLVLLQNKKTR